MEQIYIVQKANVISYPDFMKVHIYVKKGFGDYLMTFAKIRWKGLVKTVNNWGRLYGEVVFPLDFEHWSAVPNPGL